MCTRAISDLFAVRNTTIKHCKCWEKARGHIETEALEHHASQPIHPPTPEEGN